LNPWEALERKLRPVDLQTRKNLPITQTFASSSTSESVSRTMFERVGPRPCWTAGCFRRAERQPESDRSGRISGIGHAARRCPTLYQIDTRVLLTDLSRALKRPVTLDDISEVELDRLAKNGFDRVWFLGVWQTGASGRKVSLENPEWKREFQQLLPEISDQDVCGSCFAIRSYDVHSDFGGNSALERLRRRLDKRGMRPLLDFVPNHTAPDHPCWVQQHPEYYVRGTRSNSGESHKTIRASRCQADRLNR
jgi:hypothetical protein